MSGPESREGDPFYEESARIAAEGRALMEKNNGNKAELFHGPHHPEELKQIAGELFEALAVEGDEKQTTDMEKQIADLAIEFHDTVINENYDGNDKNPSLMIIRNRGAREGDKPAGLQGNEGLSAKELEDRMRVSGVYTEDQIKKATWAIDATYPDTNLRPDNEFKGDKFEDYKYFKTAVEQNPKLGDVIKELKKKDIEVGPLFFQPHLENPLEEGKQVPKEVLVVALSDLGGVGTKDAEGFAIEGNNEFRELYINLRDPKNIAKLTEDQRKEFAGKMLGWAKSQAGFATFQALRFEKIIHLLKENKQIDDAQAGKIRNQFGNYVNNIEAAAKRYETLQEAYDKDAKKDEKEAFESLAGKMGYKI